MKLLKYLFFFLSIGLFSNLEGQEIDSFAPIVRVKYIGNNKAKLRLIPRNFFEMRAIAKSGLLIKTIQIVDENGNSSKIEKLYDIDTPKSSEWLNAKNNKQIAAMAGAVFSQFKGNQPDEFASIQERVNFQNNLHLFAITASSFSWEAAKLANLGVEIDLKEGATYKITYELKRPHKFCPNKKQSMVYAVVPEVNDLSQVLYQPGDLYVNLKWPKSEEYFAFDIEKKIPSLKGDWKQVNTEPLLPSSGNDSTNPFFHVVVDSTFKNYQFNAYRIFGYNIFGERKLVTTELSNAYSRDLTPPPTVSEMKYNSQSLNQVQLTWKVVPVSDFSKIKVYYGNSNRGPFKFIKELKATATSFVHDSASHFLENYYVVSTIDTANNEGPTLPFSAITLDTIPPPTMEIKTVNVAVSGVVKIVWKPLKIDDLGGYRLSRSFGNSAQWSPIFGYNLKDTVFYDTLPLKTMKGNVFYGIRATDLRGNFAHSFVPYKLLPPDVVPPAKPLIYDIKAIQNGHTQIFVNFDQEDTKWISFRKRELIQKNPSDWSEWTQILAANGFEDTNADFGKWYEYQVKSVDLSGNQSDESNIFGQRTVKKPLDIRGFLIQAKQKTANSVIFNWNKPFDSRITRIEVYRLVPGTSEFFVSSVDVQKLEFVDLGAPRMQFCKYKFKVIALDGQSQEYPGMIEILMKE